MKLFREHKALWDAGKIRLINFAEATKPDGTALWYAPPLGLRVVPDKAELFEALGYRPSYPGCRAHANLSKIRIYSGGARAGKSLWGGMEALPVLLTPDTRTWIVAPEYDQGLKEFEYIAQHIENDEIRKVWGSALKAGKFRNSPKNGDIEIRLKYGPGCYSFVKVKSAERKRSLLSEELDLVIIAEASQIPEVAWSKSLQMRLTTRQGVAIFPSTPDGTGWYDKLFRSGLAGDKGVFAISADSRMNPTMSLEEIGFWTDPTRMSDEDFEEQVRGRPTPRHGRVYQDFDRQLHVMGWQREWPLPTWKWGRGFDFGFKNPYAVVWIATDGERFYAFDEVYRSGLLTDEVIRSIAKIENKGTHRDSQGRLCLTNPDSPMGSVADWDASERADLRTRGVATKKAQKEVVPGIRTVSELLKIRADGRPGLYVSPRCSNLIGEFESYQWGPQGEPAMNQADHALDALRYFLHTLAPHRRDFRIRFL